MARINIERPSSGQLEEMNISGWSPWECEPSAFSWEYDCDEIAYILEGRAKVTAEGEEVEIKKGDLVHFPKGLKCEWSVIEKIRKSYTFK